MKDAKVVLPGGAGLVGQNLVVRLKADGYSNIVVIDKHEANAKLLKEMHPDVDVDIADLAQPGQWQRHFVDAEIVVMLQAQIGGNDYEEFARNNVHSTKLVLATMAKNGVSRLVHISSSVVESKADDFYTRSKLEQEKLVVETGIPCPILRPTLMFGWFDRKHLGWLSRFMKSSPVFPIPGNGRYMRQPLYVGDFCQIIMKCMRDRTFQGVFNISGHEHIDYIDMIREIRSATGSRTPIVKIPYFVFYGLLWTWALFDRHPPFTTQQLAALIAKDEFEVIDWPGIFSVPYTSFKNAVDETFNDMRYSGVALEF